MTQENEDTAATPATSPSPATPTKAGTVALVGFPNVGKSSLMNRMVEQKLSIVTPLAQTTRERVLGIDTRDGVQMVFVDTPGLVDPRYLLHRAMMHEATEVITDADVVLLLVDAARGLPTLREDVLDLVRRAPRLMVVSNKIDVAGAADRATVRAWARERLGMEAIEVSAETGEGVDALRAAIVRQLPDSPYLYPEDDVSSQPVRFFVAELVRETIFEQYEKEVPYSVAVKVEEFRESSSPIFIRAVIFVERPTQKAILIGSGGSAIKRLGQAARAKVEEFVDAPVYLDLWVKVLPRWRKNALELNRLGFTLPEEQRK
ncbi:MAG TPA: GTPase Era [Longimicrobium sp.]|nr:GTPase Era [Longimicrobium sp.]